MQVRLRKTQFPGMYWGDDCRLYQLVTGTETPCCRCGKWVQTVFRWGQEQVCARHVRIASQCRIRLTTTFACRIYRDSEKELPAGVVLRRGSELAVAGKPFRQGKFDRFELPGGGFVLVPRSRWAWAWDSHQKESVDER
jgi:hypothetical protein